MSKGSLIVVVGAMGSGKTETLIDIYNEFKPYYTVSVFKPAIDNRADANVVKSRAGREVGAIPIHSISELLSFSHLGKVVLIDEVQFFNDESTISDLIQLCLNGHDVYCFGLDLTSDGETFFKMGDLLAQADKVIKLTTTCSNIGCSNPARISAYVGQDSKNSVIKVGDLDSYRPLCRECFQDITLRDYEEVINDHLISIEITVDGDIQVGFVCYESDLEDAGYTVDDVADINTMEGVINLLKDLEMLEEREG